FSASRARERRASRMPGGSVAGAVFLTAGCGFSGLVPTAGVEAGAVADDGGTAAVGAGSAEAGGGVAAGRGGGAGAGSPPESAAGALLCFSVVTGAAACFSGVAGTATAAISVRDGAREVSAAAGRGTGAGAGSGIT